MLWGELGALLTMFLIGAQTAPLSGEGSTECPELRPQIGLDLDELMRDWYVVEIVDHNKAVEQNTVSTVIDVCPILQLSRENNMTIRLQWNENAGVLVYRFRQPKPNHPSFWNSMGYQNGSLAERYNAMQFSGTVQVMKAVNSHVVLTFCSRSEYKNYSVIMSRSRRLPSSELDSVNKMLARRGLLQGHVKEMCRGAAASAEGRLTALTLLLVAKFLISWP